jgi:hypothetical protein
MNANRIVFALDWQSSRRSRLEFIARLADRMQAELIGLFVEEVQLLHLAVLPFAREVGFPSAVLRDLDMERMQRSFHAAGSALRRACEAALRGSSVNWSFRTVRGSTAEQLLIVATEAPAPTLLIPSGADPAIEAAVISRSDLTQKSLREMLEKPLRPLLILS